MLCARPLMLAFVLSAVVSIGPTSEPSRHAGEYFVQKPGVTWVYQLPGKAKGRASINGFVDWKASWSVSLGKRQASGTWRVKEGAWVERTSIRGEGELLLLPATLTRGTRWLAPASVERAGQGKAQYEVLSIDAVVELPNGLTAEHCLAVLESAADGSDPHTHYWAPNVGKVAVQGPKGWLYQLLEFRAGRRDSAE
jgi:hypothetical protein